MRYVYLRKRQKVIVPKLQLTNVAFNLYISTFVVIIKKTIKDLFQIQN